nr:uncharacterized protein LOC126054194 [Helicoverpa armigera]
MHFDTKPCMLFYINKIFFQSNMLKKTNDIFKFNNNLLTTTQVAWLRVDTQTILTIAAHVITKNHRVSVSHGDGAWTLTLKEIGPADGGRYMCQVNTEPMMSQTHLLQVVDKYTDQPCRQLKYK